MMFETYYLIRPNADLDYAHILSEPELLMRLQGHPTYPLDRFDPALYVKALWLRTMFCERA